MKKFENPELTVMSFDVEDVITASADEGVGGPNDLPILP